MKEHLGAESIQDTEYFYEAKYAASGLDAFRQDDWSVYHEALGNFFPNMRPTDSLLDCGCGSGHFLKSLVNSNPQRHPYLCGIELSFTAAKMANEYLAGHAAIVHGSYMHKDSFLPNSFDVVTCFGTIEHSPNIEEAFSKLVGYAKPGGVIMITFPLEFEGCMDAINSEENKKNNERFGTREEWEAMFSGWLRPFHVEVIGTDLLMVFRKWVSA
jgi:SAM-dependent methyltransferase